MPPSEYTRIVLAQRPEKEFTSSTFRTERIPFDDPSLKPGRKQVLVRVTYISLDPAMWGWITNTRSYLPIVGIGDVMRAYGLGVVLEKGEGSSYEVGDTILGGTGMAEYARLDEKDIWQKLTLLPGTQPLDFLHTLAVPGLTAYFGIYSVLALKPGETVVISGAAGAVGATACQLAKRIGAKVFAIAGSDEKCSWLEEEIRVEKAFNYKSPTFQQDLTEKVGYLDAYFDNVGGEILDFLLTRLQKNARIALCGVISSMSASTPYGLKNHRNLITQRGKMEGFIVTDYQSHFGEAIQELCKGIADGTIKRKFHVVEGGVEKAPAALPMLYKGENNGKLIVKVSQE